MEKKKEKVIAVILGVVITISLMYLTTFRIFFMQGEKVIEINAYTLVFGIVSVFSILGYWLEGKKIVDREGNE